LLYTVAKCNVINIIHNLKIEAYHYLIGPALGLDGERLPGKQQVTIIPVVDFDPTGV